MRNNEYEWLLDEEWQPKELTHHSSTRMNEREYDNFQAKLYGYDNINHLNKYNHNKDMQCLASYGSNCLRNK